MSRARLVGFIVFSIIFGGMIFVQRFFSPVWEEKAAAKEKMSASFLEKELLQLEPGDIVRLPSQEMKMVDRVIEGKTILFKGVDGQRQDIKMLARSKETKVIKKCTAEYCRLVQFVSFL